MTETCHRMKRRPDNQKLFGRLLAGLTVATMLSAGSAATEKTAFIEPAPTTTGKLVGWLLVAMPRLRDPRFVKTVIFLTHHDDRGAMGLIVNRQIAVEPASKLLERMVGKDQLVEASRGVRIHYGGPVQLSQGIFVHSNDYSGNGTVTVTDQVSLTSNHDILRAMDKGKGPTKGFLAMGCARWGPGQLENEILRKDWVTVLFDDGLVFDDNMQSKWQRAMDKQIIDL
ncbi:YqgE/AlgH family protein [Alphaproteobacteria bacterium]|nr:YqgE/AlgH family protein [Alphaproteobacteria bacterium]